MNCVTPVRSESSYSNEYYRPDFAIFYGDEKAVLNSTEEHIILFCDGETDNINKIRLFSLQKKIKLIAKASSSGDKAKECLAKEQMIVVFGKDGVVKARFPLDCENDIIQTFIEKGNTEKPVDFKFIPIDLNI